MKNIINDIIKREDTRQEKINNLKELKQELQDQYDIQVFKQYLKQPKRKGVKR